MLYCDGATGSLLVVGGASRCIANCSYYPLRGNDDGSHADTHMSWSDKRRPINTERGEVAEWILGDGVGGKNAVHATDSSRRRHARMLASLQAMRC